MFIFVSFMNQWFWNDVKMKSWWKDFISWLWKVLFCFLLFSLVLFCVIFLIVWFSSSISSHSLISFFFIVSDLMKHNWDLERKNSKIDSNFYVRQDGTCSYFFSMEDIHLLTSHCNLEVEECFYIQRQCANRKQEEEEARCRVWLHSKLIKKHN